MSYTYSAALVRVTWGVYPSTDDKLRVDLVNLAHGRKSGRKDNDTIRRVLAIMHLAGGVEARRFVRILNVEPLRTPAENDAVWIAAYLRARDLGNDHAEAVRHADGALRVAA